MKSRRDKWKSHISKTREQQSTYRLKSNPKFWLFVGGNSNESWKAFWSTFQQPKSKLKSPLIDILTIQIKVEKPFGRHSFGSKVERPLGSLSSRSWLKSPLVVTAPIPRLKSPLVTFHQDRGWKAHWLPFIKIKVEKPFSRYSSSSDVEKSLDRHSFGSKVEKPFGYLSSISRLKSPLVVTALVPRLKSSLVTFHQDWGWKAHWSPQLWFQGWKAPWFPFIKIEVEKPLGCHNSGSEVEKPLGHSNYQESFQSSSAIS